MKRLVKLVKSLFLGGKNGKETGKMFYIAVKDAERISKIKTRSLLHSLLFSAHNDLKPLTNER